MEYQNDLYIIVISILLGMNGILSILFLLDHNGSIFKFFMFMRQKKQSKNMMMQKYLGIKK